MGQSTDGQICYGIMFEEDYEFPWSEHEDIDEWWKEVKGYESPFELYDDNGRIPGKTDEDVVVYHAHKGHWETRNPLPVTEVNYCSGDCPMIIIAASSSVLTANRGYPSPFEPSALISIENNEESFHEFCFKYHIDGEKGAQWYLSSYWG